MVHAAAPKPLPPHELARRCDADALGFCTTDELEDLDLLLGQKRAMDAIRFGVGIECDGYNLFATGARGVGRHTIVRRYLESGAAVKRIPSDRCYVFNFKSPHKPRSLELPPGRAAKLAQSLARLVDDLRAAIPAAFESDEYRTRRGEIESQLSDRQEEVMNAIGARAQAQGIALLHTPAGFGFAPRQGDEVMSPEAFQKLPEAEQKRIEGTINQLQGELEHAIRDMPKWRSEAQHKLRELNREIIRAAVSVLLEETKLEYTDLPNVREHLDALQEDVLDHVELFHQPKDAESIAPFGTALPRELGDTLLRRYRVNVLIDHGAQSGAPVIYEDNPTYDNLIGRIEHLAQMGALVTDFTLIKAGALHRANGGFLVLDAAKVLAQPFAWDALKRALRSREIRIESPGQAYSLVSTVTLEPEPMPLAVKLVLVGDRQLYYLLHAYDPEFTELFKVQVDFDEELPRDAGSDLRYARLIATLARSEKLRPLDRFAVARVVEHGSRMAGDSAKLSVQTRDIVDLLREADYWAATRTRAVIATEDVQRAIDARWERSDRARSRLHEEIERGTLLIDTAGARVGQVNGLSVIQLGEFAFGMPHRITARVRLGAGKVLDIEREVELGGRLHSKGVLILSGFVAGRYAVNKPLSLSASLVFEQSYGGIEGDSASSAELYALLSALAEVPVAQSLAVTGSVNQHGEVQAIGGVNEKVEGYFDICSARGLTGSQGVLIPASNVSHLMLKQELVDAVAAGRFNVYPVATIDEGMEVLTGCVAGERGADDRYPPGTINCRVEQRLADFADRAVRAVRARSAVAPKDRRPWGRR
jgi:lon-related putative ATP-dependent protease